MSAPEDYVSLVLEHYKHEATTHGTSASSTMGDQTTRAREISAIERLLRYAAGDRLSTLRLLEVGCGNGVLLAHLDQTFPELRPTGLEFSPDMIALAQGRSLSRARLVQGDVRSMPFEAASFDVVVSERCIINLMKREHQAEAFAEIARVLAPGGHYICIEAFNDGLADLNQARDELGLPPIPAAHHNLWFDKPWFAETLRKSFDFVDLAAIAGLPPENFLSSHYFVSRVLYPAITKRDVLYNTLLVQFFDFIPPRGNFSPIQLYFLERRSG